MSMAWKINRLLNKLESGTGLSVLPRDRILSAVSADGVRWRREPGIRVDIDRRRECDMVYWPRTVGYRDGCRLYFSASRREEAGWTGRILSAWSSDGLRFVIEQDERIPAGGAYDRRFATAPCLLETDTGYRMYYAGSNDGVNHLLLSAHSPDGLTWIKDNEPVWPAPGKNHSCAVFPCRIVWCGQNYYMYLSQISGDERGVWYASSTDGVNWRGKRKIEWVNTPPRTMMSNPSVLWQDGRFTMYLTGHDGSAFGMKIYRAESDDGVRWRFCEGCCLDYTGPHEGSGVDFCDVVNRKEGGYRMYYAGFWGHAVLEKRCRSRHIREAKRARRRLARQRIHGLRNQD